MGDVRGPTGTAWIPESAKVMRSGFYKFFDEPYISAVHLTEKGCPAMRDDGLSNFETNVSRSQVNWDVNEEKPNCALVQPEKGHTMIQLEGTCGAEVVADELIEGFTFEPRCLVLVMALENEREMFDSMLAAGRLLNDEFEIRINYTIATGPEPDVKLASTNCHNSHVLMRNYELDTTGQDERDELEDVRDDIEMYTNLIEFTKNLLNSQAMVTTDSNGRATLISPKPSPPPPPPPVPKLATYAPMHPPAPPELVSGRALVTRYEDALGESQTREDEIVLKLKECFVVNRADDTVCGFSSNEVCYFKPITYFSTQHIHVYAGAASVDGAQQRQVPRLRHTLLARGGLLRILCQTFNSNQHIIVVYHSHKHVVLRRGVGRQPTGGRPQAAQGAS